MSNHDESLGPEGYQVEAVEKWISENVDNLSPPFKWTRLEGGHSNLTYQLEDTKVAFEICEDAWSKDRPGATYCEKGVDVILNPSASHFAFGKSQLRRDLVVNSSKELNCKYVYVNLNGNEAGRMIYDGEILIADKGNLLARNELCSFQKLHYNRSRVEYHTG